SAAIHAASTVEGVDAGDTLQLAGSGDDQIYDGFPGFNFGVFSMNGTFDFNGHNEAFDKLSGSGTVVNSQPSSPITMTLGSNTYTGTTTVSGGKLSVGAAAVPLGDVVTVSAGEYEMGQGGGVYKPASL